MADGRVEDIYAQLKQMAVAFRLRPGDRLNEGALARELGVSRMPLREALNRLVAESLFDFRPGAGFFCRDLDAQTIFDLFELRSVIEVAAVRLACIRASDAGLQALHDQLYATGLDVTGLTVAEACARDEAFHLGVADLAGNAVMRADLERINERIRYIRWIGMSTGRVQASKQEHKRVMAALLERDEATAADAMQAHITRRMDQITDAVRDGISSIYMDGAGAVPDRIIEEVET